MSNSIVFNERAQVNTNQLKDQFLYLQFPSSQTNYAFTVALVHQSWPPRMMQGLANSTAASASSDRSVKHASHVGTIDQECKQTAEENTR